MGRVHTYKAGEVEVRFDTSRCIHAAECVRGLPQVFDTRKTPWVQPEQADAERVKEVVLRCPTGALSFVRRGVREEEAGPSSIRVLQDGPLLLRGAFRFKAAPSEGPLETRLALCRCGASSRKPYCDGSHRTCGFRDASAVQEAPGTLEAEGPVTLQPLANGPVLAEGPLAFLNPDGSLRACVMKCALCRCGASGTKPFCDGAHKGIGFRTE